MKGDWLPLMHIRLIDAIMSKVCRAKFSNAPYDIIPAVLK